MKKLLVATAMAALISTAVNAEDIKLGVILGYTGPIESLTPDMAAGAELAIKEVSESGALLGGSKVMSVRGDTTCTDSAAATAATERLVTSDKINAIVGGDCSGVTTAMLQNVALANGIVMVSPSATSPALSSIKDNGLFFRTAPSDARQGQVLTAILNDKGIKSAALTYTNNDYGKGLANSIKTNFEKSGGKITISAAHEDGKADYTAEVGALAAAGGDVLIVAGYLDQGGKGIIQAALDTGAFETFVLPDGMIGDSLPLAIGKDLNGSFGTVPGTDSPGAAKFGTMAKAAGFKAGPFASESYDAAALIMLAMQAAKSSQSKMFKGKLLGVANAPGTKIYPGELAKGLKIIASGGEVDYVGASAVELIGPGESAGNYREILVSGGKNTTARFR
ncbi:MAG: ABC transporter substrate-binding protein [Alphaproteobacteria bacterium]|jgi:branched-chain amino acid transport system substrate-binding protein|nr:branched-chain amino acid ABC transporter substrate-binding protein [Rhodospirillaceae bacterium]MDP6022597.1 ABC transporter substrate-binding protein [Alphaproteobacteria bacterium]MDP6256767.1 ABC transporter substrate-binding protein [Alphaproteobacteria bacterium]MDP7052566.1 ABC transporter substrate-binding protein [Alphaproteobacteria bacterium]MDP7228288.1 ABC transporter substrate-binding protein [Alphaproteobacteria bacterium]|tara:strand:+ start:1743 stop:2924 length:1182 start_codon:yes stop_codon:yes gene_type:complete